MNLYKTLSVVKITSGTMSWLFNVDISIDIITRYKEILDKTTWADKTYHNFMFMLVEDYNEFAELVSQELV